MWPEAESNCRPLVFQIWANLLTLVHFTLTYFKFRYLLETLLEQLEYLQTTVVPCQHFADKFGHH